jgi:probable rRNA maturation factor
MIEAINRQKTFRINLDKFEGLLRKLVKHYRLKKPELVLAFVDNKAIQKLNRDFRKKDAPTDVLSFPYRENGPDGKFYLGDIIISVPKAFDQARELGHGLDRELEYLAIHGFLHLLGYEHSQGLEEEEKKIRRLMGKA